MQSPSKLQSLGARSSNTLNFKTSKAKLVTDAFNAENEVQETLPDDDIVKIQSEMKVVKDVFLEMGDEID